VQNEITSDVVLNHLSAFCINSVLFASTQCFLHQLSAFCITFVHFASGDFTMALSSKLKNHWWFLDECLGYLQGGKLMNKDCNEHNTMMLSSTRENNFLVLIALGKCDVDHFWWLKSLFSQCHKDQKGNNGWAFLGHMSIWTCSAMKKKHFKRSMSHWEITCLLCYKVIQGGIFLSFSCLKKHWGDSEKANVIKNDIIVTSFVVGIFRI